VNGTPGVVVGIQKQPDVNTLKLTERVDQVLDELAPKMPEGMALHRDLLRQADFIEAAVRNVVHALRDGGLLVILVVGFFLVNLRATLITLTAIPLSLLVAVILLDAFGGTVNAMTLGGMAIAVGALVDDAVIDVENVFRRLRENAHRPASERRPARAVVLDASVEIRSSIVFATLIIILVFLPLFFLSGVEGRLLEPLGLAYVVSLAVSLLVALSLTPVLCLLLIPGSRAVRTAREARHVRILKALYRSSLESVLRRPWMPVAATLVLLLLAGISATALGSSFLPAFNEGALTVTAVTLPGTSLAESDRLGRMAERVLLAQPEVVTVARRTGRAALDEHAEGVEFAEIDVRLESRDRTREEFLEDLRRALSVVPGMLFNIGQPISHRIDHMLSGTRAALAVKVFGPDLQELRRIAAAAREAMAGIPGVVDLAVEQQAAVPALQVYLDRQAMGRLGVDPEEVATVLQAAFLGHQTTELLERGYPFDVVLRLESAAAQPASLGRLPLVAGEHLLPLSAVARVVRDATPNRVRRENGQRRLVISCNVAGRDLVSVVEDVRRVVQPLLEGRREYRVEFGGQFESARSARQRLLILAIVVILGIGFLLRQAFGGSRDALFVMANLPLALIGGVAGVHLGGGVLSVGSLIGFITVFGIATRNGIMLVAHIRHLQAQEGVRDFREAVLRGSVERLIPILMTALATGIALIPLALGGGKPGSEIQTPMAQVILCGLVSSTFLNMIVVPTLYYRFGKPLQEEDTCSASRF